MGRNEAFRADDEAASTLRDLGYSEEEIGATAGDPAISHMATEDRLRLSLRALSAEKSHSRQVEAEESPEVARIKPKNARDADTPDSDDYWQGRKDEAAVHKENKVPKVRSRKAAAPRTAPVSSEAAHAMRQAKQLKRIAGLLKGGKSKYSRNAWGKW